MRRENDGDRKGSGRLDSVHAQRLTAFSLQPKHLSSYNNTMADRLEIRHINNLRISLIMAWLLPFFPFFILFFSIFKELMIITIYDFIDVYPISIVFSNVFALIFIIYMTRLLRF